jgi:hypothetical protein
MDCIEKLPTYKVHLPSTMIWFHIDPNIEFKHGKVGDVVSQKQVVKVNVPSSSGEYKILGVDNEFNRSTKVIILQSTSLPHKYLNVREGEWQNKP